MKDSTIEECSARDIRLLASCSSSPHPVGHNPCSSSAGTCESRGKLVAAFRHGSSTDTWGQRFLWGSCLAVVDNVLGHRCGSSDHSSLWLAHQAAHWKGAHVRMSRPPTGWSRRTRHHSCRKTCPAMTAASMQSFWGPFWSIATTKCSDRMPVATPQNYTVATLTNSTLSQAIQRMGSTALPSIL